MIYQNSPNRTQSHIWNLVEHLRWSFFTRILNDSVFAKGSTLDFDSVLNTPLKLAWWYTSFIILLPHIYEKQDLIRCVISYLGVHQTVNSRFRKQEHSEQIEIRLLVHFTFYTVSGKMKVIIRGIKFSFY